MSIRVYLDTSVYQRQFDDQSQPRVWLESMAFSVILQLIENKEIELATSTVVAYENSRNPSPHRRQWLERVLLLAIINQMVDESIRYRALILENQGIKALDALHAAAAESANADYFITCDDRFLRRYKRLARHPMTVCDPTEFVRLVADNKQGE